MKLIAIRNPTQNGEWIAVFEDATGNLYTAAVAWLYEVLGANVTDWETGFKP